MDSSSLCRTEVFSEIFKKQFRTLYNYLYYRFGDLDAAKDMAQEAFAALWQNCDRVTLENAKAYVFKVAHNKTLNSIKHEKVVLAYQQYSGHRKENIESPEYLLEERQFREKLHVAIANLREPQRVAFLMHRVDKMKYSEIAGLLGITVKAVEKRIHLAMLALKDELGELPHKSL